MSEVCLLGFLKRCMLKYVSTSTQFYVNRLRPISSFRTRMRTYIQLHDSSDYHPRTHLAI